CTRQRPRLRDGPRRGACHESGRACAAHEPSLDHVCRARSDDSLTRLPPNKRLKLAARCLQGRIAFVIDNPAGQKARPPHLTKEEPVMKSRGMRTIATVTALVSALGGSAMAAQDKYTVKVPGGLAFSEFRGYESWNVVSISQDGGLRAAIVADAAMIASKEAPVLRNRYKVPAFVSPELAEPE